jgi:hypothetical protein
MAVDGVLYGSPTALLSNSTQVGSFSTVASKLGFALD